MMVLKFTSYLRSVTIKSVEDPTNLITEYFVEFLGFCALHASGVWRRNGEYKNNNYT